MLVIAQFVMQQTFAVPAYPHPVNYTLPDGSEITIQLEGDEFASWAVSLDGFTILLNTDGFWEYAIQDQAGNLELSGVRVHNEAERAIAERNFVATLSRELTFSLSQIETMNEFRAMRSNFLQRSEADEGMKLEGTVRIPVILVAFADRPFGKTKTEFEMLLDQLNYTAGGITGSLRDYFRDVSYNKLDLRVDVFGPYTLPGNASAYAYHSGVNCSGDPRIMAGLAVDSAYHRGGANFANYVIGNSTFVSTVHIIFAGHGAEAGGIACASVWSHAWSFSPARVYNGKTISRYSCSPELRGNSGTNITFIGVIAHELGHSLLGWPDFYNTDRNTNALALDQWCLMASGSWNNGGQTPPRPCAWAVVDAGWVPEVTLSHATPQLDITLPNPLNEGIVYRINTKLANGADNLNEYFLLENRQRVGWDTHIPGTSSSNGGMLIYHIDRPQSWGNCVNCNPNRRRNYIKQAGCGILSDCAHNRQFDPWPQPQLEKTEFTDNSVPNSLSFGGVPTEKPITDINRNTAEGTISFRFLANPRAEGAVVDIPTLESKTHNSITVHTLTPPSNGQTVQYAISTSNSATPLSLSWQVATTFSGLWPLEFYYVYARSAANNEFYVGTPSISEAIQTSPHVSIRDIEIRDRESLQAWVQNGVLHIKGLNVGQIYRIYNISGIMIYQGTATANIVEVENFQLLRGTYIIHSENKSVKITL